MALTLRDVNDGECSESLDWDTELAFRELIAYLVEDGRQYGFHSRSGYAASLYDGGGEMAQVCFWYHYFLMLIFVYVFRQNKF